MSPLLALAVGRFRRDLSFARLALLGFLWHIFTDLCTSWGTIVYWPFDHTRVAWDILFIIDFTFTAVLLLPHLLAWIYREPDSGEPEGALRRGALIGASLAALVGLGPLMLRMPYNWGLLALLLAGEAAGRHIVEYTDLRFRSPYRQSPFVFGVVLNSEGEPMTWGLL